MSIPFTILGGYLGSGKTTRVNELLSAWEGEPVAVVVNDFGSVNVDADLLRTVSGGVLELENGCVCCSLADGMPGVLRTLAERAPAQVVLELSGVGLPAAARSWAGYPGFRLHAVPVCVDVTTLRRRLADLWVADVVRDQLRGADELLLTRTDLIDVDELAGVREVLQREAPGIPVSTRTLGEVLLGVEAAAGDSAGGIRPRHLDHVTRTLAVAAVGDPKALRAWLAARPQAVVRVKGVLDSGEGRILVQVAGDRVELAPTQAAATGLVLIATPEVDAAELDGWCAGPSGLAPGADQLGSGRFEGVSSQPHPSLVRGPVGLA